MDQILLSIVVLHIKNFSQRYADSSMLADEIPLPELRRQDTKNRQNSIDDVDPFTIQKYQILMQDHFKKEWNCIRVCLMMILQRNVQFVLPLAVPTRIHDGTLAGIMDPLYRFKALQTAQKEHMDIAESARCIFCCQFPTIAEALDWNRKEDCPECYDQPAILIE